MRPPSGPMLPVEALNQLSSDKSSAVIKKKTTLHMALSPGTLSNIRSGVESQLQPHLNRYYPSLGAILLGWDSLKLSSSTASLLSDTHFVHVDVVGQFYLFTPQVGTVLSGVINKTSAGHVGCLVHQSFNVSLISDLRTSDHHDIGDTILVKVTKMFWSYLGVPIIQARLVSSNAVDVKEECKDEPEYDSGIESTEIGTAADVDTTVNDITTTRKEKKSRKRKGSESMPDADQDSLINNDSLSDTPKRKKKKKKTTDD